MSNERFIWDNPAQIVPRFKPMSKAIKIQRHPIKILHEVGTAGSGDYAHPGRPGVRGGSLPSSIHIVSGKKVVGRMPPHKAGEAEEDYQKRVADNYIIAKTGAQLKLLSMPRTEPETLPRALTMQVSSITGQEELEGGISKGTELVTFEDGTHGVFKPASGEYDEARRNISNGYPVEREVGAWEVAHIVGMDDMVPITVERMVDGERGSLQDFVENAQPAAEVYNNRYDGIHDAQRAAVFDYVVGNEDRHANNWMIDENGKMHLIDHSLCFPDHDGQFGDVYDNQKLLDHIGTGVSSTINPEIVASYVQNKDLILSTLTKVGLPATAIERVGNRIDDLGKYGYIPDAHEREGDIDSNPTRTEEHQDYVDEDFVGNPTRTEKHGVWDSEAVNALEDKDSVEWRDN